MVSWKGKSTPFFTSFSGIGWHFELEATSSPNTGFTSSILAYWGGQSTPVVLHLLLLYISVNYQD